MQEGYISRIGGIRQCCRFWSQAQDVGKEEGRGARGRAWDMGRELLLARYPVF